MGLFKSDPLKAARSAEEKATAALKAAEAKRDAIVAAEQRKIDDATGVSAARQELTTATLTRAEDGEDGTRLTVCAAHSCTQRMRFTDA